MIDVRADGTITSVVISKRLEDFNRYISVPWIWLDPPLMWYTCTTSGFNVAGIRHTMEKSGLVM